jgi:hypothetical protein
MVRMRMEVLEFEQEFSFFPFFWVLVCADDLPTKIGVTRPAADFGHCVSSSGHELYSWVSYPNMITDTKTIH